MNIELTRVNTFTLKSGARCLNRKPVAVGINGLAYDRQLCLVSPTRGVLSQKTHPSLARVRASVGKGLHREVVCCGITNFGVIEFDWIPFGGVAKQEFSLYGEYIHGRDLGDEAADYFSSYLGEKCRLLAAFEGVYARTMEGTEAQCNFQEGFSVSLLSEESVVEFNRRSDLQYEVPADQFRMSLIIRDNTGELEPNFEDRIKRMRIGEVEFEFMKRVPRCVMVNIDQETGTSDSRVLRTLAGYRKFRHNGKDKVWFGTYLRHCGVGTISAGDEVKILEWQDAPSSE